MFSLIFPKTSRKPVLLLGNGVRAAGAEALARDLIDRTHIPALTTMNAVDLVIGEHRIGFIGTHGARAANMILDECDLIISVGARLSIRQIGGKPERFAPNAKLIRADIDLYELNRDVKPDEEKHLADAADFLRALLAEDIPDYSEWLGLCLKARDILKGLDESEGNRAVGAISKLLPENAIVAVDVGQHQCWCAQSLNLKGPNSRMLIAGGFGAMGCALPMAIGASVSSGGGIVYCVTGDGGLQMNIQELEAVHREGHPIKIVVLNNRVLGKIYETQRGSYGGRFACTSKESGYTVPDFARIANAYGIRAATLGSYEELQNYADWFTDGDPCLLNVVLAEDSWLVPKVDWSSGAIKPEIDRDLLGNAISVLLS